MELIFFPTGLVSTLMLVKTSLGSHLPSNLVPTTFKSLLSSPIYVLIFMNLMVALIVASSYFDKLNKYCPFKTSSPEAAAALMTDHFPLSSPPQAPPPSLPFPSAPPVPVDDTQIALIQTNIINQEDWKDITEVAEASKISKMYSLQSSPDVDVISRTDRRVNDYEEERQIQVVEGLLEEDGGNDDEDGDNSLEDMWKVIRGEAEKPEPKKSETFPIYTTNIGTAQSIDSRGLLPTAAAAWKELRKTVTFDDTISMRKRAGLMRDCLMTQESLGKRADAFINSIKNSRRIEREESIIRSRHIRIN